MRTDLVRNAEYEKMCLRYQSSKLTETESNRKIICDNQTSCFHVGFNEVENWSKHSFNDERLMASYKF